MKKIIYNKYDKTEILKLPVVEFQGRIVVVYSEKETRKAVDFLLSQPILGFDTETRPSFKKGSVHKVALMQVSTPDICFLFRLNQTGMTPDVIRLLEDTTVPKIGLSLNDDILSLHRNAQFTPGLFIDLQDHMREIGIEDLSLQKLYANIFGLRISKNQRLTNWEAQILSDRQKIYAATDAWACINLYREYLRLVQTGDYELVVIPEPEIDDTDNSYLP
ncbi:MAG: 3'-5' exonuclease domain-containing protein 2 [Prevotella sp.]|nr:3'-5' exonuclease domain-containing protein 2 [Prevotella sp.]